MHEYCSSNISSKVIKQLSGRISNRLYDIALELDETAKKHGRKTIMKEDIIEVLDFTGLEATKGEDIFNKRIKSKIFRWIISIIDLSKKEELTTIEIYNEIKEGRYKDQYKKHYPDKRQPEGSVEKGLNRRTVLRNLNKMYEGGFLNKRIDKNNVAYWSSDERSIPFQKLLINLDIEAIKDCSKRSIPMPTSNLVHIYGFPFDTRDFDKKNRNDLKQKYSKAIKKLRSGVDDLEHLIRSEVMNQLTWRCKLLVSDKNIPKIDREMFSAIYGNMIGNYFYQKTDEVLDLFKKHFYPKKSKDEISKMWDDYYPDKKVEAMLYNVEALFSLIFESPIAAVAVVHSFSGSHAKLSFIEEEVQHYERALFNKMTKTNPLRKSLRDEFWKSINAHLKNEYGIQENPENKDIDKDMDDLFLLLKDII